MNIIVADGLATPEVAFSHVIVNISVVDGVDWSQYSFRLCFVACLLATCNRLNADLPSIGPLQTNFRETWITVRYFDPRKHKWKYRCKMFAILSWGRWFTMAPAFTSVLWCYVWHTPESCVVHNITSAIIILTSRHRLILWVFRANRFSDPCVHSKTGVKWTPWFF